MPLFLSDAELESLRHDPLALAERADAYIRDLYAQLDTVSAQADASFITAEQTCSQLEHTHLSLSNSYSDLQFRHSLLQNTLQQRLSELAQVQSDKHQLHLKSIEKDGEVERMSTEISEMHKSKRQLMAMLEQKDVEINEKNSTIQSYLDKIVNLNEKAAEREGRLRDAEAELVRSQATCERLLLEKELVERHNVWLNEELTAKTDSLMEFRKKHVEHEADMSAKLRDVEKQYEESVNSVKWYKERISELEMKLTSLQEDLCKTKDSAASTEEQYVAEISTVSKLVELYKESSDEWSKKAGELEGVIKALETHLSQLQNEHKEKADTEEALRREAEMEAAELREKLIKCEAELESSRKARELSILPLSSFSKEGWVESFESNDNAAGNLVLAPSFPDGVSGTALAASLLRDGWSMAKMYGKYQEAVDALRHEQLGRKQSQAVLERVLLEIEEKASVILDERAEHERMAEAYALMNEKLHQSLAEQAKLEKFIQQLKSDLRRRERDCNLTQKEIADLQKQVTLLLKECQDIQLRCGSAADGDTEIKVASFLMAVNAEGDAEKMIAEHLITFKDINGLVEQNVKLRSLVRSLSDEIENKETELKEQFEVELQKHGDEASAKVASVFERAEQQGRMIDSLHSSVAMYKRLYEEEHKLRSSDPHATLPPSDDGRKEKALLFESSQNSAKQVQEQYVERVRCLEEELTTLRSGLISLRAERDKFILESNFAREKLDRYVKDMDHQRGEMNGILTRNVEFQRLIVDYQKQLRESAQSLLAAEEHSRKLTVEISVLKREKELLHSSERRAYDEVRNLSERANRLQGSLDTIHITEQVREEARAVEMKKLEEHTKNIEKEWAEAKKELQIERDNARVLSLDRDNLMKDAMRQIEQMGKELATALQATTAAETNAETLKERCSDLERKLKTSNIESYEKDGANEELPSSIAEIKQDLSMANEEIERLKLEAQANKDHMLQYKNIAEVNEAALKQMESSFELFKSEVEKRKIILEEEISSLRGQISQLESDSTLRSEKAVSVTSERETALVSSQKEIANLRNEISGKVSQVALMEVQISSLKADLEKEHQKWRTAQENYERQVVLQAETIQELTKTSEALALLQEKLSKFTRLTDEYKSESEQLKAKLEGEMSDFEKLISEAENKYTELNDQNKILHTRLEAMRIKLADLDRQKAGMTAPLASMESDNDSGLGSVVSYLRRSKEIAETEISLLKQEKLRLQSQLERALKEAGAAQAALGDERAIARTMVFTEEDFKSLQLQVREMNLLRQSNMQLREENKHNLDACKKLHEVFQQAKDEADSLKNLLRERQIEVDALRKEIDLCKKEEEDNQKKISEDNIRIKNDFRQMQVTVQEKEREIEQTRSLLSQKEEIISKLENDIASTRSELMEKESIVLQNEANLRADLEKQKKLVLHLRRRIDIVLKEKESLSKEKEMQLKEKILLTKDKESLMMEKELLTKEKEGLMKQLEEGSQQEIKATGDVEYQTLVNEKDKRIQTLEKVIEREREEKKKEKERRMLTEKAIEAKVTSLDQERKKFEDQHEKHKEAVKRLDVELEKLKHANDSLPEGTSVVQLLSGSVLDDLASSYVVAIQSFERLAQAVLHELGAQTTASTSVLDSPALTGTGPAALVPVSASPSVASPARATLRAAGDREKKTTAPKSTAETRKLVRKLVRPRLVKQDEPQGDSEMAEMEGPSSAAEKAALSNDTETHTNPSVAAESQVRKRVAASSTSELHVESLLQDVKRSKGNESSQKHEGHSSLKNVETPVASEVHVTPANVPQGTGQDINDARKDDVKPSHGQPDESKEHLSDDTHMHHDDFAILSENVDKVNDGAASEEVSKVQFENEPHHTVGDITEHEEGEVSEFFCGTDVGDAFNTTENDDAAELQPETAALATDDSPLRIDEDQSVAISEDASEATPDDLSVENLEEGEVSDDDAKVSEISNDGNNQVVGEAKQSNETAAATEVGNAPTNSLKEGSSSAIPSPTAATSTIIDLTARSRERGSLRPASLSPPVRGRGRPTARGRGRVIRRSGRQAPGDQS